MSTRNGQRRPHEAGGGPRERARARLSRLSWRPHEFGGRVVHAMVVVQDRTGQGLSGQGSLSPQRPLPFCWCVQPHGRTVRFGTLRAPLVLVPGLVLVLETTAVTGSNIVVVVVVGVGGGGIRGTRSRAQQRSTATAGSSGDMDGWMDGWMVGHGRMDGMKEYGAGRGGSLARWRKKDTKASRANDDGPAW